MGPRRPVERAHTAGVWEDAALIIRDREQAVTRPACDTAHACAGHSRIGLVEDGPTRLVQAYQARGRPDPYRSRGVRHQIENVIARQR